jgi:phosphoglycerol transferase MdoB-like AlkP superfamily enzyme
MLVATATATRALLLWSCRHLVEIDATSLAQIFGVGFFYDAITAAFFVIPLAAYVALVPARCAARAWHRALLVGAISTTVFVLFFDMVAEWLFWDEYATRFNFIAVDYLVYTREVLGNIRESYPVVPLLSIVGVASALTVAALWRPITRPDRAPISGRARLAWAVAPVALAALALGFVDGRDKELSGNRYVNELSGNGIYELAAAAYDSELDYPALYARENEADVFQRLRQLLAEPDSRYVDDGRFQLVRDILATAPERRLNVALVSVESLSAEFLGAFGSDRGITPNLDRLGREGLLFTRLYATGTRTVRGLEALSLSVPPTPGQSIVKRPGSQHLASLAEVFDAKGYESIFAYGGYGWFDNMNGFFGANGYRVVDRGALAPEQIHSENIWGVADEDLYGLALREMDSAHAGGRPFFIHVMTTSNHRPYTYPEGRIDIPPGEGRDGAVKYTDWAIGNFIERARTRPWFEDTLFVLTADHTAGAAGKTDLPLERYHIPLVIYAPGHVAPGRADRLMSQIDIPPTVLAMLHFSYRSDFFGQDVLHAPAGHERAFISTYQLLGYLAHDTLVTLSPGRRVRVEPAGDGSTEEGAALAREEAIAFYEGASYAYRHGLLAAERLAAARTRGVDTRLD